MVTDAVSPEKDVVVRPAVDRDIEGIIALIRQDEFAREHSPEVLRKLFTYDWLDPKPNLGYVLAHSDRIVGFLGAIYSTRQIDNRTFQICNFTTFCLHPDFQGRNRRNSGASGLQYARIMGEMALVCPDYTCLAFSANRAASRLVVSLGFEKLSTNKIVYRPGSQWKTLRNRGARILDNPAEILPHLEANEQEIVKVHDRYGCGIFLIQHAGQQSLVVTKQQRLKRSFLLGDWPIPQIRKAYSPASDILYLSDAKLAFRFWEQLQWKVMRKDGTVALTGDEWILGEDRPAGIEVPRAVFAYRRTVAPRLLDKLYSEFVVLPN